MTDLCDEDRALIDLARDAGAPGDQDLARIRAALASRLGAAAGLGLAGAGLAAKSGAAAGAGIAAKAGAANAAVTGAGVASAAATAGTLGLGAVAAKVVGAAVLVSMTVGVGATVVHHQRRAHAPAPPAMTAAGQPALLLRAGSDAPQRKPAAAEIPPAPRPDLAPDPRPALPAAAPAAVERTVHRSRDTRPAPSLAEEAGLLHAGVVARRSGQPGRALELFDRHALLYPRGVLAEERDAERALALADLGRVGDARAAIQEFLRAHPGSPLAARLRDRERLLEH